MPSDDPKIPTRRRFTSALAAMAAAVLAPWRNRAAAQAKTDEGRVIRGEVAIDPSAPPFKDAAVHVYLENVTELDASAHISAHLVMNDVSGGGPNGRPIRFALGEFRPAEDTSYNVRVHVDIDKDGRISRGDLICYSRNPVLTPRDPERLKIVVERVR